MKKHIGWIIVSLMLFSADSVFSQVNYRVIKVNGSIIYVRTGNNMTQGDVFTEDEDLSFQTSNSRAAVINPSSGRFILSPDNYENLSSAKSNFLPAMSNLSTRGGIINNMTDLQNQFSDDMVILCEAGYYLNPYKFPMNENQFFFLKYEYKGEEINKKLKFEQNKLKFSREEILKIDEMPIKEIDNPDIGFYYYNNGAAEYISDFRLVLPNLEQLNTELQIILDESPGKSFNQKVNDVSGYLFEFYGKPDKQDVINHLEKVFGLVKEE
jgi:hypothetical protein